MFSLARCVCVCVSWALSAALALRVSSYRLPVKFVLPSSVVNTAHATWMISVFAFDYRRFSNIWDKASCCSEGGSGQCANSSKDYQQPPLVFVLELLLAVWMRTYHTIPWHYTTFITLHFTLHYVTLRYFTLHSITCMCICIYSIFEYMVYPVLSSYGMLIRRP